VASNSLLRESAIEMASKRGVQVFFPPIGMCTDNAAMIAVVAYEKAKRGFYSPLSTNAVPYLSLDVF
jgi:N6-L-threonylcarbamoyladenine synthase